MNISQLLSFIYIYMSRACKKGSFPYRYVIENGSSSTFPEVLKVLQIHVVLSTQFSPAEPELCISNLKGIKTSIRNSMCWSRLNSLTVMSTYKEDIEKIAKFNKSIVERLASTKSRFNRRVSLLYK